MWGNYERKDPLYDIISIRYDRIGIDPVQYAARDRIKRSAVMEKYLQLVSLAKQGDTEAFARLYEEIYENMYRFALYTLRNTADAEDVVSETVVDAFASIQKLRSEKAFRSWIFQILSNKCKDKLREYAKRTSEYTEAMQELSGSAGVEEGVIVRKIFFELSDEERLIIGMHLFCGYKSREIAELLHMNENTVRSKESRGLKKMAGSMGASYYGKEQSSL